MKRLVVAAIAAAVAGGGAASAAPTAVVRPEAKPTPIQLAAARKALASTFADLQPSSGQDPGFSVASADLNSDGRPDLIVLFHDVGLCGTAGCQGFAILATAGGYSPIGISLPAFFETVTVLETAHGGMNDLRFDNNHKVFQWSGTAYR